MVRGLFACLCCLFVVISLEDAGVGQASVGAGSEQGEALVLLLQAVGSGGHQTSTCSSEGRGRGVRKERKEVGVRNRARILFSLDPKTEF